MPAEPYRVQIARDVRRRITSGQWPVGSWLPPISTLFELYAETIGVASRATVEAGLQILKDAGEIEGQQGKGIRVIKAPTAQ